VAARRGVALDRFALRHRAQLMDARELRAADVEAPVSAARRDQQLLVAKLLAVAERGGVRGCVDRRHDRPDASLDEVLVIPRGGLDVPAVQALLGAQIRL